MNKELSEQEAVAFSESGQWKQMTHRARAEFQLYQSRLCMPFAVFHEAAEKALGRGVYTHEFADLERLRKELRGEYPAPTLEQIYALLPKGKSVVIVVAQEGGAA